MKTTKIFKILTIALMVLFVATLFSTTFGYDALSINQVQAQPNNGVNSVQRIGGHILSIAQAVGVVVAVVMLVVLAIKYIAAAPADKADIKKSAMVYIFGAVLLVGGVGLLSMIQKAAEQL